MKIAFSCIYTHIFIPSETQQGYGPHIAYMRLYLHVNQTCAFIVVKLVSHHFFVLTLFVIKKTPRENPKLYITNVVHGSVVLHLNSG